MGVSFALVLIAFAIASAQDIPANLPNCVSRCVHGVEVKMISMYGCRRGDFKCYCSNPNFNFGIVHCSQEYCLGNKQAVAVVSYAASFCSSVLQPAHSSTKGGDVGRSGSTTVTGVLSGKHFTTVVPAPGGTVTALKTVTSHAPNRPPITLAVSGSSTRTLGKVPPKSTVATSTKVVSTTKSSNTANSKSTISTATSVTTSTKTKSTSTANNMSTMTTNSRGTSTSPSAKGGAGGNKGSGGGPNGAAEASVSFLLGLAVVALCALLAL